MLIGFGPPIPEGLIVYIPEFIIKDKDCILSIIGKGTKEEFGVIITEKDLNLMIQDGKATRFSCQEVDHYGEWPVIDEGKVKHIYLEDESSFKNNRSQELLQEGSNLAKSNPDLSFKKFNTACYLRNIKLGALLSNLQEIKTDKSQSLIDLAKKAAESGQFVNDKRDKL